MRSGGGSAGWRPGGRPYGGWRPAVAALTLAFLAWVPLPGGATGAGSGAGVTVNDVAFCTEVYALAVRKAGEMGNPDVQQVYRHAAGALAGIGNREVGAELFGQRRGAERPKVVALSPSQLGKAITQCNAVTAKLAPK